MHIPTSSAVRALLITLLPLAGTVACAEQEATTAPEVSFASADAHGVVASVQGSGQMQRADGTLRVFTLNAVKFADGSVSGTYNLEIAGADSPLRVKGDITCLVVDGTSAYIGGDVARFDASPFDPVPEGVAIEIIDNGEGAAAAADLLSPAFFTRTQQEVLDYCADPAPGPVSPIHLGNFQVR